MFALFMLVAGTHFAALLSPGPDFFLLIRTALTKGRRQADGCACGIALANLLSMLLVLFVMALLPAEGSWLWRGLQVVGGLYFAWIGLQALASRRDLVLPQGDQLRLGGVWKGMRQGSSGQQPQPQITAVLRRAVRGAARVGDAGMGVGLAMLWMTLVVLFWDLALVRLLDQARWRSWLQRRVRWLDRGCGGLLLALGGWLLLGAL